MCIFCYVAEEFVRQSKEIPQEFASMMNRARHVDMSREELLEEKEIMDKYWPLVRRLAVQEDCLQGGIELLDYYKVDREKEQLELGTTDHESLLTMTYSILYSIGRTPLDAIHLKKLLVLAEICYLLGRDSAQFRSLMEEDG